MSAPSHLRSCSSDSDSDLSFEVIPDSHPNDDIISESDASDCEEQSVVSFDDVVNMCSGLESEMSALSVQLEENGVSMKKSEEIIEKQEQTINAREIQLTNLKAENETLQEQLSNLSRVMEDMKKKEEMLRADNQALKEKVSIKDLQIAEEENEKTEAVWNLDNVRKQRDEAYEDVKRTEEMRAEDNEYHTRYRAMAETTMAIGSIAADKWGQLDVRNKELEEEKRQNLEKIDNLTSEKDGLLEKLKNAEEMRTSEVNKLQTMYQEHTEQSKQVNEELNEYLVEYFSQTHELKHRLAEQEAENEKILREISNLEDERHELMEKLHQECELMEELSNEMMVLTADLNEMQAEHQRVTLENMELNEQKATLEEDRRMNLTIIRGLHDGRDKLEMELRRTAAMFHQKNQACSELHKRIRDLEESKTDLVAGFQALDHRNVQLEARIAERDEEKIGDMEEIQNLRKFKNELLEEIKGKEYHANEQIGELTRRNLALEEQIRAGGEENSRKESAQEKKTIEQELRVMAEEKKQFEEKYKKYKQIAHGYKKKCEELSQQSTLNQSQSIGNKTDFKKQINGRWVLASSRKSDGFILPEKYHNWNKGHLVCELKDNQFTTSIHIGSVPTNTEHFVLGSVTCFMKNDALYTVEAKLEPLGMNTRHYFENGLLKIKVTLKNAIGIYTFVKAE